MVGKRLNKIYLLFKRLFLCNGGIIDIAGKLEIVFFFNLYNYTAFTNYTLYFPKTFKGTADSYKHIHKNV